MGPPPPEEVLSLVYFKVEFIFVESSTLLNFVFYGSIWIVTHIRCTSTKFQFFSKQTRRMTRSALFKLCPNASSTFSPYLGQFVNTTPFCCAPFIESFFHIFVWTKVLLSRCVTHRCKRKEQSLANKLHGIELPRWVIPTCREPVLSYVMEHCHGEKWLSVVHFSSATFWHV